MPSTLGIVCSNYTRPLAPVSLLLQGGGTSIVDAIGKNSVNVVGNTTISTTVKKHGSGSIYFDGSGDYLTVDSPGSDFGTGDFTIEGFWYFTALGSTSRMLVSRWASNFGWQLYYRGVDKKLSFYVNTGLALQCPADILSLNTWHHIAVSRQSETLRMFVDGDLKQAGSLTTSLNQTRRIDIGVQEGGAGPGYFSGYMDDLRITKGAIYTKNFAPGPLSELPATDPINLNLL